MRYLSLLDSSQESAPLCRTATVVATCRFTASLALLYETIDGLRQLLDPGAGRYVLCESCKG